MTLYRRLFLSLLLLAWLGMILACGGGGGNSPEKSTTPGTQESDEDVLKEATKKRDEAIAAQKQVRAKNEARKQQYEEELVAFKKATTECQEQLKPYNKAKNEYDSVQRLSAAKPSYGKAALDEWYRAVVRDFPGTEGCKEAQRRLNGDAPRTLAVPPLPVAPKKPDPPKLELEPEPRIPEVPTLAEIRERREAAQREAERDAKREAQRKAEEEYERDGLVLLQKTTNGVSEALGNGNFSAEISGTVVNRRKSKLNYAQITFNLYDESGAQVGSALANINGLESGGRWNFKATTITSRWKTYKVSGLSGF